MNKKVSATLLIAVVTALLVGLGSHFNVRGSQDNADPRLPGTWQVTVMPTGGDPIVDYATFTDDGGITNIDPDPNLSTGLGTWKRVGPNRVAVTFVHFLSDHGVPQGILKVRGETTLDPLTNTFSGPFRTDVIIGGNVVGSFCGTVQAKRVPVEALEACPSSE